MTVPAGTTKTITAKVDVPSASEAAALHLDLLAATAANMISTGASSLAAITETGNATGKTMTVAAPTLTVVASATPVASSKVINSTGVTIGNLLLTAGTAEAVKVNSVKVTFANDTDLSSTSLADTTFSNIKLMDGDTQVGTDTLQLTDGGTAAADYVQFSAINNLTVPAGQTKQISIVTDIIGAATGPWYAGISADADIVGAGATSGTKTSVSFTETDVHSAALTVAAKGTLVVSVDGNSPTTANIAVGNSADGVKGVVFSKIKFVAGLESMKVSQFVLTIDGGADSNFAAVYLYDGSILLNTAYASGTTVTFNFNSGEEMLIPVGATGKVITVKADLNGIDGGVTHADAPRLYIAAIAADLTTNGANSGEPIIETAGTPAPDTASNFGAMTLYNTTATASLASNSPSGSSIPSANQPVLKVDVTNNGVDALTVTSFDVTPIYTGSTTGAAATKLYWSDDLSAIVTSGDNFFGESGVKIAISPLSNNIVAAGVTRTLVLVADTTGLTKLRVDLAAVDDFGWTPSGTGANEVTTVTKNLPITGGTITY